MLQTSKAAPHDVSLCLLYAYNARFAGSASWKYLWGCDLPGFDARLALDELADAVVAADSGQRILFANRAVKRLLGWEPNELEGKTLSELIPPPHAPMDLGRPLRVRAARSNGTLRDVELILTGDADETIVATLRPAMGAAEAEETIRKLRAILNTISVGVLLAEGPEGKFTVSNPAADRLAGEPVRAENYAEFVAKFPLEKLDGRVMETDERPLARTITTNSPVREALRYRRKDGRELILEVNTAPFPGPNGGAVTTFLDVTQRYQLEQDLAQSAAQLRALLDLLPIGVAYFDKMAVCRAGNSPARRYLDRSKNEIIGVPADELFANAPELRRAIHRCVNSQASHSQQKVPWPDASRPGAIRYLDWQLEPLSMDPAKPRGAVALITDVTDRTHAEVEKQRVMEAIEGASRRKTQFLSAVSHDLRTPVNALSLQAELLSRIVEMQDDPGDELKLLAGDIRAAANNLIELINDLLDLTRFDSGVIDYHPTDFSLDEWLAQSLAPLELSARTRGLEFSWHTDLPGRVIHGDRVKLGRVLTNLVGNAVKFTERGEIAIDVRADREGRLCIKVRDTGPGIPTNQLERIFDEFAQLRNPERDRTKGTGLGLAICRRLVEGVGGQLLVESEPGRGSTFTAVYPSDHLRPEDTAQPPDRYVVFPPNDSPDGHSSTILVVERDAQTRTILKRLLEHEGYTVTTAANGDDALKQVLARRPALVLLDLAMKTSGGEQLLHVFRDDPELVNVKAVVLSSDAMTAETGEVQLIDADGLLAKPIDPSALRDLLSVMLPLRGKK